MKYFLAFVLALGCGQDNGLDPDFPVLPNVGAAVSAGTPGPPAVDAASDDAIPRPDAPTRDAGSLVDTFPHTDANPPP